VVRVYRCLPPSSHPVVRQRAVVRHARPPQPYGTQPATCSSSCYRKPPSAVSVSVQWFSFRDNSPPALAVMMQFVTIAFVDSQRTPA
jgi:hypothetical protein